MINYLGSNEFYQPKPLKTDAVTTIPTKSKYNRPSGLDHSTNAALTQTSLSTNSHSKPLTMQQSFFDGPLTQNDIPAFYKRSIYFVCSYILISFMVVSLFSKKLVLSLQRLGNDAKQIAAGYHNNQFKSDTRITELATLEADLENMRQALVAAKSERVLADKIKTEFLANIGHEIRTPMNGIMGMLHLALHTDLTAQQREFLTLARSSADSLLQTVNDTIDLSYLESQNLQLDQVSFSLRESLGDTLKMLGGHAHEKGLELMLRVDPATPDNLIGDADRLKQIIINLVDNAIKFTYHGEIVVQVKPKSIGTNQLCLYFSVIDTGVGITLEKQKHIFDSIAEKDASSPKKQEDIGLGLSISAHLAELMGGRLWLQSEQHIGSTFYFTAQFVQHPDDEFKTLSQSLKNIPGLSALIVDDNAINLQVFAEILANWGINVTTVENSDAAILALQSMAATGEAFSLIFLDATMPSIESDKVAKAIRDDKRFDPVTIMMLSSAHGPNDYQFCQDLGINMYVRKPVKHSELWNAIRCGLEKIDSKKIVKRKPNLNEAKQKLNILVVEDHPVNQYMLVLLLEERGHCIQVANNGAEALELLKTSTYDLILMDIQMPVMDGIQATLAIRAQETISKSRIRIIAMTAHVTNEYREKCLAVGMDAFISKPIQEGDLLALVENWQLQTS
jgi:signal transduction histidine kinase/CheY-like chemotaxis protein